MEQKINNTEKSSNINTNNNNPINSSNGLSFNSVNLTNHANKINIPIFSNSLQQNNQDTGPNKNQNYIFKATSEIINQQSNFRKGLIDLNSTSNTIVPTSLIRPKSNINQSSLILVKTITGDQINKK